jgi:hypothetical protein
MGRARRTHRDDVDPSGPGVSWRIDPTMTAEQIRPLALPVGIEDVRISLLGVSVRRLGQLVGRFRKEGWTDQRPHDAAPPCPERLNPDGSAPVRPSPTPSTTQTSADGSFGHPWKSSLEHWMEPCPAFCPHAERDNDLARGMRILERDRQCISSRAGLAPTGVRQARQGSSFRRRRDMNSRVDGDPRSDTSRPRRAHRYPSRKPHQVSARVTSAGSSESSRYLMITGGGIRDVTSNGSGAAARPCTSQARMVATLPVVGQCSRPTPTLLY